VSGSARTSPEARVRAADTKAPTAMAACDTQASDEFGQALQRKCQLGSDENACEQVMRSRAALHFVDSSARLRPLSA
jgi:hypothetical protein